MVAQAFSETEVRTLLKKFEKNEREMRDIYKMFDEFEAWLTDPKQAERAKKEIIAYYKRYENKLGDWRITVAKLWRYRQLNRIEFDKIMRDVTPELFPDDITEWKYAVDDYDDYTTDMVYVLEPTSSRNRRAGKRKPAVTRKQPAVTRKRVTSQSKPAVARIVKNISGIKIQKFKF